MLHLIVLEDKITCTPDTQDRNHTEVLIEQIEVKYLNKIILGAGLGIAFYDFVDVGDPYLYPGEGACVRHLKFRLVVFRPLVGEVLTGRVVAANKDGLKVSVGFFDDIVIPGSLLQDPSEYISSSGTWRWVYQTEEQADFLLKVGDEVRFKVRTINFTGITSSAKGITATTTSETQELSVTNRASDAANVSRPSGGGDTAPLVRRRSSSMDISAEDDPPVPMQIVGLMNDYGLGSLAWW